MFCFFFQHVRHLRVHVVQLLFLLLIYLFNFCLGAICHDDVLANLICAFLCKLVAGKMWVPSYRLVSTLTVNFGLSRRSLAIADGDVTVLRASSVHMDLTLGRRVRCAEKKVELLLHLLDAWFSTTAISRQDVELLMQLVVVLCAQEEWRSSVVARKGRKCLWALMRCMRVCDVDGLMGRMRVFVGADV